MRFFPKLSFIKKPLILTLLPSTFWGGVALFFAVATFTVYTDIFSISFSEIEIVGEQGQKVLGAFELLGFLLLLSVTGIDLIGRGVWQVRGHV